MKFRNLSEKKLIQIFKDSTLILPAVTTGNVGQLAIDLLIENLNSSICGIMETPYVFPCVGNDAFGESPTGQLTTALDVYQEASKSLFLLQQRSPIIPGKQTGFVETLAGWVKEEEFKKVIILGTLSAGKRTQEQMIGDQFRCVSTKDTDTDLQRLGWLPLEGAEKALEKMSSHGRASTEGMEILRNEEQEDEEEEDEDYPGPLEGGVWGSEWEGSIWDSSIWKMYSALKAQGVEVLVLVLFCNEGDNTKDAFAMADKLDSLLKLLPDSGPNDQDNFSRWRKPISWAHLFGPSFDQNLFG